MPCLARWLTRSGGVRIPSVISTNIADEKHHSQHKYDTYGKGAYMCVHMGIYTVNDTAIHLSNCSICTIKFYPWVDGWWSGESRLLLHARGRRNGTLPAYLTNVLDSQRCIQSHPRNMPNHITPTSRILQADIAVFRWAPTSPLQLYILRCQSLRNELGLATVR